MCVSKSIGLAYSWKEVYHFCFGLFVFEGNFQAQAPGGAYTQRDVFVEGFSITSLGALIWRGLFWEFYGIIIIPTQYIPKNWLGHHHLSLFSDSQATQMFVFSKNNKNNSFN